jgi:hypothetical protein
MFLSKPSMRPFGAEELPQREDICLEKSQPDVSVRRIFAHSGENFIIA